MRQGRLRRALRHRLCSEVLFLRLLPAAGRQQNQLAGRLDFGTLDCTDFARICSLFRSDSRPFIPIGLAAGSSACLDLLDKTGAGGENRTHDLPLTKGLRYHYATPASGHPGAAYSLGLATGKGRMTAQSDARKNRLAKALRANLKRRKRQTPEMAEPTAASNRAERTGNKQIAGRSPSGHQQ